VLHGLLKGILACDLGEARVRLRRFFEDMASIRFAEPAPMTFARRWDDGTRKSREGISHMT
jgi:hypothetical protein